MARGEDIMTKFSLYAGVGALAACAVATSAIAQEEGVQMTASDLCRLTADQIEASEDENLAGLGELTTQRGRIDRELTETLGTTIIGCEGESSGLGGALTWRVAVIEGAPALFDVRDETTVYYDLAALQSQPAGEQQISTEEVCDAGAASIEAAREGDLVDISQVTTREFDIDQIESNRYGAPVVVCEDDGYIGGGSLIWRVLVADSGALQLIYVGTARQALYRLAPEDLLAAPEG